MSKFAKLVRATPLNAVKFSETHLTCVTASVAQANSIDLSRMTSFKVVAEVGAKAFISEESERNSGVGVLVKRMQQAVIEEAFGEFRMPMQLLRMAVYDRDYDKAEELLERLDKQLFTDA